MNKQALRVRIRLDFPSGHSVGPGKVELLEHIASSGSLSQAARELRLSYRRAWILLDDLNHSFAEPVVVTATGGAHGGGARLTDMGERLIAAYRKFEQEAGRLASRRLANGFANTSERARGAAASRRRLSKPLPAVR